MSPAARPETETTNHRDFRLSITQALGDQLAAALDQLTPASLTEANLDQLDSRPGVYQLYRNDEFVYVGKADKSLPTRIRKHLRKLSGRQKISLAEMFFTCLYVDEDFSALAPEKLLIKHYKGQGKIPWNNNGFGNNDPGKQRDQTTVKANHFDALFPIDLDQVISGFDPGQAPLGEVLSWASKETPYTFRYEKKKTGAVYEQKVEIPAPELKVDELFRIIARTLPKEWQIAVLPSYAIMYPDGQRDYPSASRYYRGDRVLDVTPETVDAGEIPEETDEADDGD